MSVDQLWERVADWCGGKPEDWDAVDLAGSTPSINHSSIHVTYECMMQCESVDCARPTKSLVKHILTFPTGAVTSQYLCSTCGPKWVRLVRSRWKKLAKMRTIPASEQGALST
jgi:hypothetical protein